MEDADAPGSTGSRIIPAQPSAIGGIATSSEVHAASVISGLSVSGCSLLELNGVYIADGKMNCRPCFFRYTKSKDVRGVPTCHHANGKWCFGRDYAEPLCWSSSNAPLPPCFGWKVNTHEGPLPDALQIFLKLQPKAAFNVGDRVMSLTNWVGKTGSVSKGEIGIVIGSYQGMSKEFGYRGIKFRVTYRNVRALGTWPEQIVRV